MDSKLKRVYAQCRRQPLYTVLPARAPWIRHVAEAKEMTKGEVSISPGRCTNTFQDGRWIDQVRYEAEKRKIYEIAELGREILTHRDKSQ